MSIKHGSEQCVEFVEFEREMIAEQDENFDDLTAIIWASGDEFQIFSKSRPSQFVLADRRDVIDLTEMC